MYLTLLSLHCCTWASHCSGFSLQSTGSRCVGFSSCGTCNPSGPRIRAVSPALASMTLNTGFTREVQILSHSERTATRAKMTR